MNISIITILTAIPLLFTIIGAACFFYGKISELKVEIVALKEKNEQMRDTIKESSNKFLEVYDRLGRLEGKMLK